MSVSKPPATQRPHPATQPSLSTDSFLAVDLSAPSSRLEHMFDLSWIDDLDASAAADAVVAHETAQLESDATFARLAAHWADLHNADTLPDRSRSGRVLPGMERAKRLGADGTPLVAEFAAAEFGVLHSMGYIAADNLLRDVLNIRHRHPLLWTRVTTAQVPLWKAREIAKAAANACLSLADARWLDGQVTPYVISLPWGRVLQLLTAKIIEADPAAYEERRLTESLRRFVRTGQSNEHGIKTLIARANAGDIIFFVAMVDRIAYLLQVHGDTDPADVRRSKAIGILADPVRVLALLESVEHVPGVVDDAAVPDEGEDTGAPDEPQQSAESPAELPEHTLPERFTRRNIDPKKLLPPATLYIHCSRESMQTRHGVARMEGVGPLTIPQVTEFLRHCNVTVKPVIDPETDAVPVDAYEVPTWLREIIYLLNPAETFPFGNLAHLIGPGTSSDVDHTVPFVPQDHGGPPGQTELGNLSPLTRFPHRIKTHGRWRHHQPSPGVHLWRTPHGYWFRVDNHGTHPLGKDPDLSQYGLGQPGHQLGA